MVDDSIFGKLAIMFLKEWQDPSVSNRELMLEFIRDSTIGGQTTFEGPFGRKKMIYCDYTASGKSLTFIEDFIRNEVLPFYGNTHTTNTASSLQTTVYRCC